LLLHLITGLLNLVPVDTFEVGDKLRLKSGPHCGVRGHVLGFAGENVVVHVEGVETPTTVSANEVTNFSLAARKAWLSMPKRQVGRPKGTKFCDRISVTLRIDRDLWERFRTQEALGCIKDRTETINAWLRQKLDELPHSAAEAKV
jgi:uncharacterized protein (DUF4415 family)